MTRLGATHRQVGAPVYLAPGGAWDVPTLDELARSHPVRRGDAVSDSGRRLDAHRLEAAVAALAGGLRSAGVRRGDAVAWQLPNGVDAVLLFRACWRLGAVAVPIHHQVGPREALRMLEVAAPRLVVSRPGLPLADAPGVVLAVPGARPWEALVGGRGVETGAARGADLAVALFTSGSTGEPKAVLHTHRGLASKALTMVEAHGLGDEDAVLMPAPLSHISGLLSGLLIPAAAGMRAVFMERWDPELGVQLVDREQISFMIGPPTFFFAMPEAASFDARAVASLRVISVGSMTVNPEFIDATRGAFDAAVKRTYGSTEAPTITTWHWSDPPERARDSDGRALGASELRVVDPETGRVVAPGHAGELELRGPELFCGYAEPTQTAAAMHRGWFATGDLATLDAEGWLRIIGRRKELIIRGGENIVPAEIERVLESHPRVRQAVVVGYADDRLGQRVAACVLADGPFDVAACRAWFTSQGLARFKVPEHVERLDAFPLLSLGKPDRAALGALVAERTGSSSRTS